jgi:epoxyqueuosine reductase
MLTAQAIKAKAAEIGFDVCGIARAGRHPKLRRLRTWLDDGRGGDMQYLRDSLDERLDVTAVLPTARSVVSLGTLYNTAEPYSHHALEPGRAAIARYAWGRDYHETIRGRLRELLEWMAGEAGPGFEAFSCVDNGPIQERVFAEQAGVGWIGKNTCVINPRLGSWLFLAEVVTSAELEPDAPAVDQCGSCTRCLDACPTGAITEPYTLDATRCLSYLTIETRGDIEPWLRPAIDGQIFGCDICQDVCPWNGKAPVSADPAWQPHELLVFPPLTTLCQLTDEAWRALLRSSAMRRAGLHRIRRSLAYAAANLPAEDASAALDALGRHPSAGEPEVAAAIAWSREQVAARAGAAPGGRW